MNRLPTAQDHAERNPIDGGPGVTGRVNGKPHDDLPPVNIPAEKQTLASIILLAGGFEHPEVAALRRQDFSDVAHQQLFPLARRAFDERSLIDGTTLSHGLVEAGAFADYREALIFIKDIVSHEFNGNGLRIYASEVMETARRRRWWLAAHEAAAMVRDGLPPEDVRG